MMGEDEYGWRGKDGGRKWVGWGSWGGIWAQRWDEDVGVGWGCWGGTGVPGWDEGVGVGSGELRCDGDAGM